ncbi:cytochrome c oxidase subunit II [bacterium]|nr:cytochrome c oxidase subunit II [bacterium]
MDTTGTFLLPPSASTMAGETDALFYFLYYLSIFFFILITGGVVVFAIKFRRKKGDISTTKGPSHNTVLETAWIVVPLILVMIIFVWGFKGFMKQSVVPKDAMEIKVTAQKWFWSFSYPDGTSTANELVVPAGKPIKLLMSSQDVIHSFFVPSFRLKRDVLPNRYTVTWFEALRPGDNILFCAEYCGTKHSEMLGKIKVVSDREFKEWLDTNANAGADMNPADYGAKLYTSRGCVTCHSVDGSTGNGPSFLGVFGHEVALKGGTTIVADENYIRESILNPQSKVVAGFQPIMPTYQGLLKDRDVDALVAYIKSLGEK